MDNLTSIDNFRYLLGLRLGQLEATNAIEPISRFGKETLCLSVVSKLQRPGFLEGCGVDKAPRGLGNGQLARSLNEVLARTLGRSSTRERLALRIAVGSALRQSELEGKTFRGLLRRKAPGAAIGRWDEVEAIAFARRFHRRRWSAASTAAVVCDGEGKGAAWPTVLRALVVGDLVWSDFARLRHLRKSYDSYVNPWEELVLPTAPPATKDVEDVRDVEVERRLAA